MGVVRDTFSGIFKSKAQIEIEAKHSVVETVQTKLAAMDAEIAAAEQRRRDLALNLVLDDNPEAVEHLLDEAQRLAARRQLLADALAAAERQEAAAAAAEAQERDRRAVERQAEQRRGADRALAQHLGRFQSAHRDVEKAQAALDKAKADLDAARGAAGAVLPQSITRHYKLPSGHYLGDLWGADTLTRPLVNEVVDAVRQIGREQLGLVEPPPPPPEPGPWQPDEAYNAHGAVIGDLCMATSASHPMVADRRIAAQLAKLVRKLPGERPEYEYSYSYDRLTVGGSHGSSPSHIVDDDGDVRAPTVDEIRLQVDAQGEVEKVATGRRRRLRVVSVKPVVKPIATVSLPAALPVAESVEPEVVDDTAAPAAAVHYTPDPFDPLLEMARAGGRHDFQRPAPLQDAQEAPSVANDAADDTDTSTALPEPEEAPEVAPSLDGTLVEPASSTGLGGGATPNLEDF